MNYEYKGRVITFLLFLLHTFNMQSSQPYRNRVANFKVFLAAKLGGFLHFFKMIFGAFGKWFDLMASSYK